MFLDMLFAATSFQTIMIVIWCVFVISATVIELNTGDLVTVWFILGGIGALIVAICGGEIWFQLIALVVISVAALFATRPIAKRLQEKESISTNADRVIGMVGIITVAFKEGEIGQVIVNSVKWRATSMGNDSFSCGEKVQIDAISGTKLIVSKIINDESVVTL